MNESAEDAIITIDHLTELHNKNLELISQLGRTSKSTTKVFNYLEANPIIDIQKTSTTLSMSFNTVSGIVKRLI